MTTAIEHFFRRIENPYKKLMLGGSILSILIFLFPPLYGEGYHTINTLINGSDPYDILNNSFFYGFPGLMLLFMLFVILTKAVAATVTNCGDQIGFVVISSSASQKKSRARCDGKSTTNLEMSSLYSP